MDIRTSFAVEYGGGAVGGIGFKLGTDIARLTAEMGHWAGGAFWRQGLQAPAAGATSAGALDEYKPTPIFAMVFSHNVGSIRVLEKAGCEREGIMRRSANKNGVILDQVLYAKVR